MKILITHIDIRHASMIHYYKSKFTWFHSPITYIKIMQYPKNKAMTWKIRMFVVSSQHSRNYMYHMCRLESKYNSKVLCPRTRSFNDIISLTFGQAAFKLLTELDAPNWHQRTSTKLKNSHIILVHRWLSAHSSERNLIFIFKFPYNSSCCSNK